MPLLCKLVKYFNLWNASNGKEIDRAFSSYPEYFFSFHIIKSHKAPSLVKVNSKENSYKVDCLLGRPRKMSKSYAKLIFFKITMLLSNSRTSYTPGVWFLDARRGVAKGISRNHFFSLQVISKSKLAWSYIWGFPWGSKGALGFFRVPRGSLGFLTVPWVPQES